MSRRDLVVSQQGDVERPQVRFSRSTRAGWQSGARAMPRYLAMELAVQKCNVMWAGMPWAWRGVQRGMAANAAVWAQQAACGRRPVPPVPARRLVHCMAPHKLTETGKLLPQQPRRPLSPHSMGSASDDAAVLADFAQLKLDEVRILLHVPLGSVVPCSSQPLAEQPSPHPGGRRGTPRERRNFSEGRLRRGSSRTSSRQPRVEERRRQPTKPTAGKVCVLALEALCSM